MDWFLYDRDLRHERVKYKKEVRIDAKKNEVFTSEITFAKKLLLLKMKSLIQNLRILSFHRKVMFRS